MKNALHDIVRAAGMHPRVMFGVALGVTTIFFAVSAIVMLVAERRLARERNGITELVHLVDAAARLHEEISTARLAAVNGGGEPYIARYRELNGELQRAVESLQNVPNCPGFMTGLRHGIRLAHSRLQHAEEHAIELAQAGQSDSALGLLTHPDFLLLESDFHTAVRRTAIEVESWEGALTARFVRHLMLAAGLVGVFMVSLTVGWMLIVLLIRRYYRAQIAAEAALRESELKYRTLIDALPQGVLIIQDLQIRFGNPAAAAMIGYPSPADLVNLPIEAIVNREEFEQIRDRALARERGESDVPVQYTVTGRRRDGREFPVEVHVRPIEFGGRYAAQVVFADITERQRAEEALRESEERFRNLADLAPVLIWMAGVKRHTYYFNRTWLNFTGRTTAQEYGLGWQQGVYRDDLPRVQSTYEAAFAARNPFTVEYRLRHADGTYHWVLDTGVPRFAADHQFAGYIGSCVDVSIRLDAEQALRDNEQRFRTLYNRTPAMLQSLDAEAKLVGVSDYWLGTMGYERNEVLGRPLTDFLTLDSRRQSGDELIQRLRRDGEIEHLPLQFMTKSGRVLDTLLSAVTEREAEHGTARFLAVTVDVTERNRAQDALRKSEELLRESQAVAGLGSYVYDISSDHWTSSTVLDRIFGIAENYDRTADGWLALVRPDWRETMRSHLMNDVIGARGRFDKEYPVIRHSDGVERWVHGLGRLEFDENNRPLRMIGTIQDVTDRKRTEQALEFRLGFERLTTRIANRFINVPPEAVDDEIQRALTEIGRFMNVDRSYVFQMRADGRTTDNTHEWCAPGVSAEIANLQDIDFPAAFPYFAQELNALHTVTVHRLSDLPPEAVGERAELEREGIQSLVLVPLILESRMIGFIGFDSVRAVRHWSDDDMSLLRVVGDLIVSALAHRWADWEVQRIHEQYAAQRNICEQWQELVQIIAGRAGRLKQRCYGRLDSEAEDWIRHIAGSAEDMSRQVRDLLASPSVPFADGRPSRRPHTPRP